MVEFEKAEDTPLRPAVRGEFGRRERRTWIAAFAGILAHQELRFLGPARADGADVRKEE